MTLSANGSTHVTIDGKEYLYFGGSNYLSLAHRKEIWQAADRAFQQYGFSSGASRLTSGENDALLCLEDELAAATESESALVLPAGFLANQTVVDGLSEQIDAWIINPHAHASIHSALGQSGKPVLLDADTAGGATIRERLHLSDEICLGIFVEEIDPLKGALHNVPAIANQAAKQDFLIVDEAHSFGVLGKSGMGCFEHYQFANAPNFIRTGTFSKAVGTYGGFVLASSKVIDQIKEKSLCFKGSTSLPPALCEATRASLSIIRSNNGELIAGLQDRMSYMSNALRSNGIVIEHNNLVPIYWLKLEQDISKILSFMIERAIYIPAMSSYFAGQGELGLRWTVQVCHKNEDFDLFSQVLAEALTKTF